MTVSKRTMGVHVVRRHPTLTFTRNREVRMSRPRQEMTSCTLRTGTAQTSKVFSSWPARPACLYATSRELGR